MIYNINTDETSKECFICLEVNKNKKLIQMGNLNGYSKECSCCSLVHNDCLYEWYSFKMKCPICRIEVERKLHISEKIMNEMTYLLSRRKSFIIFIFRVFCNSILVIMSFIFIFGCVQLYIKLLENVLLTSETKDKDQLTYISPQDL